MEQIIIFIILAVLGYTAGTLAERKHYRSIETRERRYLNLPAVTTKKESFKESEVENAILVSGNAVISLDYFKRILAGLRNIFGGEVVSYETLIDRARREAILRMKEKAGRADVILNLRIETSSIGQTANKRNTIGSIEAIAYGTAITLKKT
ncbi:MAG: heavy metal-binding domain-containing protein [Nitrospirota bacterium]